jgi:hypothetical protein
LWLSPSTQGHITIAVGATRLIQQASWPGARDDVAVRIAEPLGRVADRRARSRSKVTGSKWPTILDLDAEPQRLAIRAPGLEPRLPCRRAPPCTGERKSMVKTTLPGMMLREFG